MRTGRYDPRTYKTQPRQVDAPVHIDELCDSHRPVDRPLVVVVGSLGFVYDGATLAVVALGAR